MRIIIRALLSGYLIGVYGVVISEMCTILNTKEVPVHAWIQKWDGVIQDPSPS